MAEHSKLHPSSLIDEIDPMDRLSEFERRTELLETAIAAIKEATWTPKINLPQLRRRIALALKPLDGRVPPTAVPRGSNVREDAELRSLLCIGANSS
jgi:hypothetical protein